MGLIELRLVNGQPRVAHPRFGFDPAQPTNATPGSPGKLALLEARYTLGLPLWLSGDRRDQSVAGTRQDELVSEPIAAWED